MRKGQWFVRWSCWVCRLKRQVFEWISLSLPHFVTRVGNFDTTRQPDTNKTQN
jgi:hypothetical protein